MIRQLRALWAFKIWLLFVVGALIIISIFSAFSTQAAVVPQLATIRVAMFVNLPSYSLTTSTASLSSTTPLTVSVRNTSNTKALFTTSAPHELRTTLDDYKVKIVETADASVALAAVARLKEYFELQTKDKLNNRFASLKKYEVAPMLTIKFKNSKKLYEVIEGSYATYEEAQKIKDEWNRDTILKNIIKSSTTVRGNLHWESGTYATRTAAQSAATSIGATGVDTFVAMKQKGTAAATYTVLVGAALDQTALSAVKTKASSVASNLVATDATANYVVLANEYTGTSVSATPTNLLFLPLTTTKITVSTSSTSVIKFKERYGRSYRGLFELRGYNGELAVVNELPFEQYLYSVVGSEMPASWNLEALKAQAVAARTYAIYSGHRFTIAHVVDTTLSQAYNGISSEKERTIAAVNATIGEIAHINGVPINTLFTSSAGGRSADPREIWGGTFSYLKSVVSNDSYSEKGLKYWYRIVLPDGRNGFVREDFLQASTEKSVIGQPTMVALSNVNVRKAPYIDDSVDPITTLTAGTRVVILEKIIQSNPMRWIRGPYTAAEILASLKNRASNEPATLKTLEISQRGVSGRATELKANDTVLKLGAPDNFRSALGGLPSTLFTIDEMARMTILGKAETTSSRPNTQSAFYVVGKDGQTQSLASNNIYVVNNKGDVRAATKTPTFMFEGTGFGHGVGLSQYGAQSLAESGKDYKYILKYYYTGITVSKE